MDWIDFFCFFYLVWRWLQQGVRDSLLGDLPQRAHPLARPWRSLRTPSLPTRGCSPQAGTVNVENHTAHLCNLWGGRTGFLRNFALFYFCGYANV